MPGALVICFLWLGGVLLAGFAAAGIAPRWDLSRRRWPLHRVTGSIDAVSAQVGRLTTGLFLLLAGWATTIIICWYLGELAQALEDAVDWPLFDWVQAHQVSGGWSSAWQTITNMGSPMITGYAAAIGAVVFAIIWRVRGLRWWVPGVTVWGGLVLVRYAQFLLKDVVDRGHPPTTLGTWPSGGCARVLVIYGLLLFFATLCLNPKGPRPWVAWATATAFLTSVQGYARLYNLEHWFTDVAGGIVFGVLIISLMVAFYFVIERSPDRPLAQRPGKHTSAPPVGIAAE